MLKIKDAVEEIVLRDDEVIHAFSNGLLNLSAYAKRIRNEVENETFKEVSVQSIVVALSRIQERLGGKHPIVQEVKIEGISTKLPLTELVFEKSSEILANIPRLYKKVNTKAGDFITTTLSSNEIGVICSERLVTDVKKTLDAKPTMEKDGLASLGISFDPKYYDLPNVGYSLIRKVALRGILLAEIVSTHTEMIFVFHKEDLSKMVEVFSKS